MLHLAGINSFESKEVIIKNRIKKLIDTTYSTAVQQLETRDSYFIRGEVKSTVLFRGNASRTTRVTNSRSDMTSPRIDNESNSK